MITLLALVSCQPLTQASTTAPKTVPEVKTATKVAEEEPEVAVAIPAGHAIVRECYASPSRERKASSKYAPAPPPAAAPATTTPSGFGPGLGGLGASGYGTGGGGAVATGAPAADKKAEAPAPAKTTASKGKAETKPDASASFGDLDEGGAMSAQPAPAVAAEATAQPTTAPKAQAYKGDDGVADSMVGGRAQKELEKDGEEQARRMTVAEPDDDARFDWGGTTWLSNDDSMSLASAQRLLWAIQNKGPVSPANIRPHEFLNYFSFETQPVAKGDTFSVLAAAERTAPDTLTMSFAVKGATPKHAPLDLTMVLDRSGSMAAEGRMEYLKRGLHKMESQLKTGDRVDLVLFDDVVCTPLEDFVVGRDDPSLLTRAIDQLQPRGSTDLDAGLREGYRIAKARVDGEKGRNRRMMLISDALLNTGEIDPGVVTEVAKSYESSGIRLTAVGVGRDFNDSVLDMLSEKGKGAYVYLGSEAVVDRIFGVGFESLTHTIAHDVRFELDLPPSLAMERFYGEEMSTVKEDVQPINYFAGTTQLFLQDLKMRDGRAVASDPVKLTVHYTDATTGEPETQVFTATVGDLLAGDARNLHKARALMAWTDLVSTRALGGDPCAAPFDTWRDRVDTLGDDAEISWLDGLTSPLCGAKPVEPKRVASGVPLKVKVDSDLPIAEVTLACDGGWHATEQLAAADTVARFSNAKPGSCRLTLEGNVPMTTDVEVPTNGGDVRCMIRGGRVSCG